MNRTIKLLMISDIFVITGFGLLAPIIAIFIKEGITGGTIFTVGFASTIFLVTKSIIQLPFSRYVDSHDRKVRWLVLGTFIMAVIPFIYIFATKIQHIYIAQVIYGIGAGVVYPTWLGLWSTHLDKKHESFEWGVYATFVNIGTAITAATGAGIAQVFGYAYTFILSGIMALVGCFILFLLEQKKEKPSKVPLIHYHQRRKILQRDRLH